MPALTVESAKTELKDVYRRIFAEIGKLMDGGLNHLDAFIQAYKDNPDAAKREQQLLDFLKMAQNLPAEVLLNENRAGRGGKENMEDARIAMSETIRTQVDRLSAQGVEAEMRRVDREIDQEARNKMRGDGRLQYHDALKLVASERPDLDVWRTYLGRSRG